MSSPQNQWTVIQLAGLASGCASFFAIEILDLPLSPEARHAAAIVALMLIFWFTEALPIHITALAPLVAFPVLGVFPGESFLGETKRTALAYLDANTFLFLGGMCIAASMERWNLHRRVALTILARVGGGSTRIVLGFLLATAFVSLWISNTATAVMMTPIAIAVIGKLEEEEGRKLPHLALAVMLCVAYGSNVGGIGTKIGTAPNVVFCQSAEQIGRGVSFLEFMAIGLPFVILFLPLVWLALAGEAKKDSPLGLRGRETIEAQLRALGPMSGIEKWIGLVFLATAAMWIGGKPISESFGMKSSTPLDASVAMGAGALLFLVPLGNGRRALDFAAIRRIPFSVLILLGGSFAMAEGVGASGLLDVASRHLALLRDWPPLLAFLTLSIASVAVSAVASNTATTTLMMGILRSVFPSSLAVSAMATSAIAASCDFMLPAGTPPNAVVFGSGRVPIRSMIRIGAGLDLAAGILAGLWGYFGVRLILDTF